MLFIASLANKVTDSTAKKGYCIFASNNEKCQKIVAKFNTQTITYTPTPLKVAGVTSESVTGTDGIVVFIEDNEIPSDKLAILRKSTAEEIKVYLCKVTVQVAANAEMDKIPLAFHYVGGPIHYKGSSLPKLSQSDIKKINIEIQLQSPMEYDIYDNIDSKLPDNFKPGDQLSYNLVSTGLDATRLIFKGDDLLWGVTTFTPGATKVTVPTNTIASWNGTVPKAPFQITGKIFADDTFVVPGGKNSVATVIANLATTSGVLAANVGTQFFTGETATEYAVQCIYDGETVPTKGCPNIGYKSVTPTKIADATVTAANIVAFHGDITIPNEKVGFLDCVILTNDATSIKVNYAASGKPKDTYDLRKPIWHLNIATGTGASVLAPTAITFNDNVNPEVILQSTGITFTVPGIAITDENTKPVDATKLTFSGDIVVKPYLTKGTKVEVGDNKMKINDIVMTLPGKKPIKIAGLPGQDITVSQNNANKDMAITLSTTGNIAFDATWNNYLNKIITTQMGTVSTQYEGASPPWLTTESLTQGTIQKPSPKAETPPSKGLEAWAIALIVIACVIVVGAIVVVSLNFAGVIHLCGKSKVEV